MLIYDEVQQITGTFWSFKRLHVQSCTTPAFRSQLCEASLSSSPTASGSAYSAEPPRNSFDHMFSREVVDGVSDFLMSQYLCSNYAKGQREPQSSISRSIHRTMFVRKFSFPPACATPCARDIRVLPHRGPFSYHCMPSSSCNGGLRS